MCHTLNVHVNACETTSHSGEACRDYAQSEETEWIDDVREYSDACEAASQPAKAHYAQSGETEWIDDVREYSKDGGDASPACAVRCFAALHLFVDSISEVFKTAARVVSETLIIVVM